MFYLKNGNSMTDFLSKTLLGMNVLINVKQWPQLSVPFNTVPNAKYSIMELNSAVKVTIHEH